MRIDKFLKVSRIIKRRTLAKEAADRERILVKERIVKPSYIVKVGDVITILLGLKEITIRVKSFEKGSEMYDVISEKKV